MKRYPAYRDSGVEWLGAVPGHWRVVQLKHVCKFFTGWTPPTGDSEAYVGENLWANISDLGQPVIYDTVKRLSDAAIARHGIQSCPAGSLLFSFKLSIGQVSFAGQEMYTNEAIATFPPSPNIDLTFAFYAFPEMVVRNASENIYGAKMLNQFLINSAILLVPPLPEQTAIAAFLDLETAKIDGLVAEQRRLIDLLREKRQAMISHAVTKGLNPATPLKPSGIDWLGDVPAGWRVAPLKMVATVQTGIAKGKDTTGIMTIEVPYLRVANVQDGHIDLTEVATMEIPVDSLHRYTLKPGDVLMNEGGDFDKLGRGHVWDGQIDPCIHQNHVFAVRPHGVSPDWLNLVAGTDYAQFFFMGRSKQSTNLASISSTNLMELPVVIPPPQEQTIILTFLADMRSRLDTLTATAFSAIALLQERRAALISAAVTGKIDVRHLVQKETEAA